MAGYDFSIPDLCAEIKRSRQNLQYLREQRRDMVRQRAGLHYAENGAEQRVPINLLALYEQIISRELISKNPRALLSTFRRQYKASVKAQERWLNKEIERARLEEVLHRAVVDSLYAVGIIKVALADPGMAAATAWTLKAGDPFAMLIDLDDFAYDDRANDFDHCAWMAHRYRVPLEVVRKSELYSKHRKELQASGNTDYNAEGDERISVIGKGRSGSGGEPEFEEMVELWEVYLPRHRLVVTLADDAGTPTGVGPNNTHLRCQNWIGPDRGPYHILGLGRVAGNAMPSAPMQHLYDLHLTVNESFRKLERQASRLKQLSLVTGGSVEDGERIKNEPDGGMPVVSRVDSVVPLISAGPNPNLYQFFEACRSIFSWLAGNLDSIGGLSAQSKTATQDQLLASSSSKTVQSKQEAVVAYTADVIDSLLWFHHHHPSKVMRTAVSIPGLPGGDIEQALHPAGGPGMARNIPYEDLEIKVDPYSMPMQTPQMRLQALNEVVTGIIIPLMPILQQQGKSFDLNAYLDKVGVYLNQPDLAELVDIVEPPTEEDGGGPPEGPTKPGQTERTYVRENRSGRTQEGDTRNRINMVMGQDTGGDPQRNGKSWAAN